MRSNAFLIQYARRHYIWIIVAIALDFLGAIFNGVSTTLVVPVLLGLSDPELLQTNKFPAVIKRFIGWFDPLPDGQQAIAMIGVIAIAIILKNLANYIGTLSNAKLSQALTRDMRQDGLKLLLEVDLDYHHKMKVGDIVQLINDQISRTTTAIRSAIKLVRIVFNVLLFAVLLVLISWKLTITASALMVLVVLLNQRTIQRSRKFGRDLAQLSKQYSVALLELLAGIRLVKATGNEAKEYDKVKDLIQDREQAALASQANSAKIAPVNEVASIVALIVMVMAGRLIFANQLETLSSILLTYLFILSRLIPFLGQLNSARSEFANSSASIAVVNEFLTLDNKPFMSKGTVPYHYLENGIEFRDLWFRYPGTDDFVLQGINLKLPKGTTLALVGASGAGKSTLADLLPRFYDPDSGEILIDGQNLKSFDLHSLRAQMGIVSQETFLFNDTIRYNIAYARPDATDAEIIDAAQRANAYEFIQRLPKGLDTPIGDRGVLLSGGQRQRLSIARALLQDPDILILDEATSALDTLSERLVQSALDTLSKDRTTLVIAHRLSTIQNADQIAVLDQGKVVELGTHETLLQNRGHYARLCAMQFQEKTQQPIEGELHRHIKRTSHYTRTRLNAMLGMLQLLIDDLTDSPEEQKELTQEAYELALDVLKSMQNLEQEAYSRDVSVSPITQALSQRLEKYRSNHPV